MTPRPSHAAHRGQGPSASGRGRAQQPQTFGRIQRKDCMFYRSALVLSIVVALVTACGPAAVSSVSVESSGLAAATLGGAAQAVSAQATPPTDFQFPPPAPNQTPGPNVVAPSPLDDRTPPP